MFWMGFFSAIGIEAAIMMVVILISVWGDKKDDPEE